MPYSRILSLLVDFLILYINFTCTACNMLSLDCIYALYKFLFIVSISLDMLICFKCLEHRVWQEVVRNPAVKHWEAQQQVEAFLVLSSHIIIWDGVQT
jgi:hypothetical protein